MNRNQIWVSPTGSGDGRQESPLGSLTEAVQRVQPGETIILMGGNYSENCTFSDISGTEDMPISVRSADNESVTIGGEWYLYNSSDWIFSDISFKDCPHSALSLVGESERNIFKNMVFEDCGTLSGCALFTGGNGGRFNIFEQCSFISNEKSKDQIALFISQSEDPETPEIRVSRNSIVRGCRFSGFDTAVVVGSGDDLLEPGNTTIEDSLFNNCDTAIRIKGHGTYISGAIFKNCKVAIQHRDGRDVEINNCRFDNCPDGVFASSGDATIHNSCFINSRVALEEETIAPTIFFKNSFIFSSPTELLTVKSNSLRALFSDNLFFGGELPESEAVEANGNFGERESFGTDMVNFSFANADMGDYTPDQPLGCITEAASRDDIPEIEMLAISEIAKEAGYSYEDVAGSIERREVFLQSLYPEVEVEGEAEEEEQEEDINYFDRDDE